MPPTSRYTVFKNRPKFVRTEPATGPALLMDVDGVLDPYLGDDDLLFDEHGYMPHPTSPWWIYNPTHGPLLLDFAREHGFELVWCTFRQSDANEHLSRLYGFGVLDSIVLPDGPTQVEYETSWKYASVLEWAGDRPIAWLDDEHGPHGGHESEFLQARRAPTKLVKVDPERGLLQSHLDEVVAWKEML
jgi:hypothetical protein